MRISFIGAGKVGTAFGAYLKQKGCNLTGYYSRSIESSSKAAAVTGSCSFRDLKQLGKESDIIFITTSDDQIENVCQKLCQGPYLKPGQYIIHMSGALPSTILSAAKAFGCHIYSMHPLLAFADTEKSILDLQNAYFCIEGDEDKITLLEDLLKLCGNPCFKLKPEHKVLYHASACMLSNYLVTLVHNGLKIMENIQVDSSTAFEAMLPLVNSTIQNILSLGTEAALTGPIARGDINTVEAQLNSLQHASKEQLALYAFLSQETLKLAKLSKLSDNQKADKLEYIIESFL